MDVITILQPENHLPSRKNSPLALHARIRQPEFVSRNEPVAMRFLNMYITFPVIFALTAVLCFVSAPRLQDRYGGYRLGTVSFAPDSLAESSLRSCMMPEASSGFESEGIGTEIPSVVFSVVYSMYTVKPGDTVSGIVSRFGLRNMSSILSVNAIDNARRIRAGQILKIPSMDGIVYTVVRGDSLARISERFGIPVNAVLDANDLEQSALTAGQRLFIPGAALSNLELRKAMGELFITPIRGRLTSSYGYRKDPFTGVRSFHTGIDLAAPTGTLIKAALDGKIATSGYSPVYGNYVIISHDGGYQTLYGHLSSISVKRGQRIVQGATVGRVGNTGYSTGSHLHFSVYKSGKTIDPFSVLK
ncbi:MAG: Murein DD-endopeptidase MepM [Spirochaetes bacterium ADurb.Bin269]|nr:MAG: Murein DD-endopeptidase MepM [Spirochaetes bacterium ADurb.Bin269]HQL31753.1 M23 family metallopeptidase [Treponemataceae bacterium]